MADFKKARWPDFNVDADKCKEFIEMFADDFGDLKYMDKLQALANREAKSLVVELDDVFDFRGDQALVDNIQQNTRRYITIFEDVVDSLMPQPNKELTDEKDVLDILMEQRQANVDANNDPDAGTGLPKPIRRRFEIFIQPRSLDKPLELRAIRAANVGHLVKVRGIITRMSDVQPQLQVATYTCDVCGHEVYQEVKGDTYTPLQECVSPICAQNKSKGKLYPQTRGSKFLKVQKLKLQEMPNEVPVGHIPRSLNVLVHGEYTRKCVPGDIVTLSGIFLVVRYSGFRAIKAGLVADTFLEVQYIKNHKKTYSDFEFTEELEQKVLQSSREANVYTKLSQSIAPEIYGMEDVKKALLLLLVGAPTRVLSDKMRIRGDINILLCGDPGVAKSQLLKHISSIAPRGVYTTGKGSSGVGLTAAVNKDPVTGEMTLEGGALVLADMGVCCIDEFDKMEEGDRTAIYEVMEQQTVSIAKAGITTTLNARASVLAAANPRWGRYDPSKPPETNINLPTALLSRFDLTFVLLDQPDEANDQQLARHITYVHRTSTHPALTFEPFESSFLRAYISKARQHTPFVPKSLTNYIVSTYVQMRSDNDDDPTRQRFCTPRTLLSILRLAQALARLRFAESVEEADVMEASRLLFVTKAQLLNDDEKEREDTSSAIFQIIKTMFQSTKKNYIKVSELTSRVLAKGFTKEDVHSTIDQYEDLDIIALSSNRNRLFLSSS